MEILGQEAIQTFLSNGWSDSPVSHQEIRSDEGFHVPNFRALVGCIAKLSFYNPRHMLLFRGQGCEYFNRSEGRGLTVLKPSIFRVVHGQPLPLAMPQRYERLQEAERLLLSEWDQTGMEGYERITRNRIVRWAILQHYEICRTPLLDATHSLRVASSFASLDAKGKFAVLYVLAVPQLSGAITASADAGIQIVRLSGICPPLARRPHFQEGYLIGEYPEIPTINEKRYYEPVELDCCRRLLAKFRLELDGFWSDRDFPRLSREALFPDGEDQGLEDVADRLRRAIGPDSVDFSRGSR